MSGISPIQPYDIPGNIIPNVTRWNIQPTRAVLLIHDMQHYFLRPFDQGHNPASALIQNSERLKNACRQAGVQIAYTAQPGNMSERQRGLLNDIWGPGMNASQQDREVIPSLAPQEQDWQLTKWRYSAFVKTNLLELMKANNKDQLIISGIYAHIGIMATAIEAFSHDIKPFVVADATADFSSEDHTMALTYMAKNCAEVVTTQDLIEQMED